ncbi:MAG: PaaI family thioesterase [Nitrospirae bacterium]|nr:PaaI family thioesterase [Nitrospirota bacterium]
MKHIPLCDDGFCFACGKKNHRGLQLEFRTENGRAITEFIPHKVHQGFKDIVHGGIITAVLDETIMKLLLSQGIPALTAEIAVRFRHPLFVGEKTTVEAEIQKMGSKLIEASALIKKQDNSVIASAKAKLIRNA